MNQATSNAMETSSAHSFFFSPEFESAYTVWIPIAVFDYFFCFWSVSTSIFGVFVFS